MPGGERVDRRLWRRKGDERVAAVEKIEDQRKPEDFFGYRNRITPYGVDCKYGKLFGKFLFDLLGKGCRLPYCSCFQSPCVLIVAVYIIILW